jgi:mRNA-degrading endonuclease RelE of RelBE toxin-antitoxin system
MTDESWSIAFIPSGRKDLNRLDQQVRRRVYTALQRLAADPDHTTGVRKLTGRSDSRLRVGDWRVSFETDRESRTVIVHRVLTRGRAYNR